MVEKSPETKSQLTEENLLKYKNFLKKVIKNNGDKLLPRTLENYCYFIEPYIAEFSTITDRAALVERMNAIIKSRPSIVITSAFKQYAMMIEGGEKKDWMRDIYKPKAKANAQTSKRFLQSKVLSVQELQRLFNEVNDEDRLLLKFAYDTGCRKSEILNAKIGDIKIIDGNNGQIAAEINILGKGYKNRTVFLTKSTVDLLQKLRDMSDIKSKIFFFHRKDGKPYVNQESYVWKKIDGLSMKILDRHWLTHGIRHTKSQHLANSGADVLAISSLLGHSGTKSTEIYVHNSSFISRRAFSEFSDDIDKKEETSND